jgi:hypothetical protein
MTRPDITGTDAQGSRSGPRPDQAPGQAPSVVLDIADLEEVALDAEDDTEPSNDADDLPGTVRGDDVRPLDHQQAPRHVAGSPKRTL